MALIAWNSDLIIQIPEMDREHEQLVNLVNLCHEYTESGLDSLIKEQVLPDLITATQSHFTNEEELMEKYQFPELPVQKMVHQNLLAQITYLHHHLVCGEIMIHPAMLDFLVVWVNEHIQSDDRRFGIFLNARTPG